ncbi:hypothetical protein ACA910_016339 [Epithemia clementina (nom. ined.)]
MTFQRSVTPPPVMRKAATKRSRNNETKVTHRNDNDDGTTSSSSSSSSSGQPSCSHPPLQSATITATLTTDEDEDAAFRTTRRRRSNRSSSSISSSSRRRPRENHNDKTDRAYCGHDTPVTNSTAEDTYAALLSFSSGDEALAFGLELPIVTPSPQHEQPQQEHTRSSGSSSYAPSSSTPPSGEGNEAPSSSREFGPLVAVPTSTRLFASSSSTSSSTSSSSSQYSSSPQHHPVETTINVPNDAEQDNSQDNSPEQIVKQEEAAPPQLPDSNIKETKPAVGEEEGPHISYLNHASDLQLGEDQPQHLLVSPLTMESRGRSIVRVDSLGLTGSWELLMDKETEEHHHYRHSSFGSEHIVEFEYETRTLPGEEEALELNNLSFPSELVAVQLQNASCSSSSSSSSPPQTDKVDEQNPLPRVSFHSEHVVEFEYPPSSSLQQAIGGEQPQNHLSSRSEHIIEFNYQSCAVADDEQLSESEASSEYEEVTVYSDQEQARDDDCDGDSTEISSIAPCDNNRTCILWEEENDDTECNEIGSLPSFQLEDLEVAGAVMGSLDEDSYTSSEEESLALPALQKKLDELERAHHLDCSETMVTSHTSLPLVEQDDIDNGGEEDEQQNGEDTTKRNLALSVSVESHESDPPVEFTDFLPVASAHNLALSPIRETPANNHNNDCPTTTSGSVGTAATTPLAATTTRTKPTTTTTTTIDDQVRLSTTKFDTLRLELKENRCLIQDPSLSSSIVPCENPDTAVSHGSQTETQSTPTLNGSSTLNQWPPLRRKLDEDSSLSHSMEDPISPRPRQTNNHSFVPSTPRTEDNDDADESGKGARFDFATFRKGFAAASRKRFPLSPAAASPVSLKDRMDEEQPTLPVAQQVRNNVPTEYQLDFYPVVSLTFLANPLTPATVQRVLKQSWDILQPGGTLYVCHVIQRREDHHQQQEVEQSFSSDENKDISNISSATLLASDVDLVPAANTVASIEPYIPDHMKEHMTQVSVGGVKQRKYEIETLEILQRGGHVGATFSNQHDLIHRWRGVKPKMPQPLPEQQQ